MNLKLFLKNRLYFIQNYLKNFFLFKKKKSRTKKQSHNEKKNQTSENIKNNQNFIKRIKLYSHEL